MGAVPGTAKETRTQRQGAWKRANCGNGTSACQAHVVRSCGCRRTEREGKKDDPALRENPKKAERAHEDFRPQGWSSKGRERRKDAVSSGFGLSECQQRRQWGPAAMPTPILFFKVFAWPVCLPLAVVMTEGISLPCAEWQPYFVWLLQAVRPRQETIRLIK